MLSFGPGSVGDVVAGVFGDELGVRSESQLSWNRSKEEHMAADSLQTARFMGPYVH